jgi:serine/threonine protein kinase
VMGEKVDQRSDIYAVGVSMFECLTGEKPYAGGDVGYHHVHSPVPELPNVHPDVAKIVKRCMAKKKEDRFESASALLDEIRTVLKQLAAQSKR